MKKIVRRSEPEYLTRNVFVAGAPPSVTYNPRDDHHLESEVENFLAQSGKALSVSGPTKCGKTVLIRRLMPPDEAIWIEGADLVSVDYLWHRIVDWFGLYDTLEVTRHEGGSTSGEVGTQLGIPGAASVNAKWGGTVDDSNSFVWGRRRKLVDVAREALETLSVPIVVDDFHYVPDVVKRDVARAIKSVLPVAPVVLIAVPHESFEAVREEPDMGGRVWQLKLEPWSQDELRHISIQGFRALNVMGEDTVGPRLAKASYGAPFLMQQLCCDLMLAQKILETQRDPIDVDPPEDWEGFLRRIANRQTPAVFEKLLKGPNPRGTERTERVFKDGRTTDIYGAVMHAIGKTGPKTRVRYQELVKVLERDLVEVPRGQHVTNSLAQMAKIARESRGSGDAVLDYKDDELHVMDPFLLFFLEFGTWDVGRHALS